MKCINPKCKKQFTPFRSGQAVCSEKCNYEYQIWKAHKDRKKQSLPKRERKLKKAFKKKTAKDVFYGSKAWDYCRKFVKLYYSDEQSLLRCFTSNKLLRITGKGTHVGHYIKVFDGNSTNYATAFLFENLGIQSMEENRFNSGSPEKMRAKLIEIHGEETIKNLETMKNNICKADRFYFDYYEKTYKELLKDLIKKKGNPFK